MYQSNKSRSCLLERASIVYLSFRLELAEERALGLTGQMSADECMTLLKVRFLWQFVQRMIRQE